MKIIKRQIIIKIFIKKQNKDKIKIREYIKIL